MKKRIISLALCACLSLTAFFGGFRAKAFRGGNTAGLNCDLPAELEDQ